MPQPLRSPQPIVTDNLSSAAQIVIAQVRQNTPYPFLIDAKLGDANAAPTTDSTTAETHDALMSTISYRWGRIVNSLAHTDHENNGPLQEIARRANDIIAGAAIVNRHVRRPPIYAESTIDAFIALQKALPEHRPLIRAAGYLVTPPVFPRSHDISSTIPAIAAHMARSHEPQSTLQIFQSLNSHQDALAKWPSLDLTLFIRRMTGIQPDEQGLYHPGEPWGSFLSKQLLVTNTMYRIFAREQKPCTTSYLKSEIERMVGNDLPNGYNTVSTIRRIASTSDKISWQGTNLFGLSEWSTAIDPRNMVKRRGNTGDLVYSFLMQHGPAHIDDIIEDVQRTGNAKAQTIKEALRLDPSNRFIQIYDQRVAANPIPQVHNPGASALIVVPDDHHQLPATVLHESELLWLTRYVQALNNLAPPLPSRVAVTGQRAAGFSTNDPITITAVVDPHDSVSLEPRLATIAADTTELVPGVRPSINILSPQQWAQQQAGEDPEAHHNAWLAPDTAP